MYHRESQRRSTLTGGSSGGGDKRMVWSSLQKAFFTQFFGARCLVFTGNDLALLNADDDAAAATAAAQRAGKTVTKATAKSKLAANDALTLRRMTSDFGTDMLVLKHLLYNIINPAVSVSTACQ
jgi:hypothetical protein